MRGKILTYSIHTTEGVISGDDGERYAFDRGQWRGTTVPRIGQTVDFVVDDGKADSIFPVAGASAGVGGSKNKIVAALLAFFLGTLGVHKFYLGRPGAGIAMLLISLTVIGLLVTGIWALIDFIMLLIVSDEEFAEKYG